MIEGNRPNVDTTRVLMRWNSWGSTHKRKLHLPWNESRSVYRPVYRFILSLVHVLAVPDGSPRSIALKTCHEYSPSNWTASRGDSRGWKSAQARSGVSQITLRPHTGHLGSMCSVLALINRSGGRPSHLSTPFDHRYGQLGVLTWPHNLSIGIGYL